MEKTNEMCLSVTETTDSICDSGEIALIDCNTSGMQHLLEDEEFKNCIL